MYTPIPSPPGLPVLGNVDAIDKDLPMQSLHDLAVKYGEIYSLTVAGDKRIIVNSQALMAEVSDEKRFAKKIAANSNQLRNAAGDGLFTARLPEEKNWYIAHNLLMPLFTPEKICNLADDMMDIMSQLVLKWERFGADSVIDIAADFSRVTLDTICLCAMDYRLNSFYRETVHPFAIAMADFLLESTKRGARPELVQSMLVAENKKYEEDQKTLFKVADEILAQRRAHPTDKEDILNALMYGRDKETGQGLPDKTIQYNLLTFLIAGNETTSGMLVFAIYYLLKNPEAMQKLRDEIDTTLGGRRFTTQDLNSMPYLIGKSVMRETLRLTPTAPARTVAPFEDTTIGGKYLIHKGESIIVNTYDCQRDKKVWGQDADEFKPERMLDGKYEAMPRQAWQAFGYGLRACIGGSFAWQEAQIALVTIFQQFDLAMDDPKYQLQIKQTLSIKPKNLFIRASPRKDKPRLFALSSINNGYPQRAKA
ncbi:cytochrome P450 [Cubamyces lactineus]|nr:cytochrome P450 [Cubamyces lactineus]